MDVHLYAKWGRHHGAAERPAHQIEKHTGLTKLAATEYVDLIGGHGAQRRRAALRAVEQRQVEQARLRSIRAEEEERRQQAADLEVQAKRAQEEEERRRLEEEECRRRMERFEEQRRTRQAERDAFKRLLQEEAEKRRIDDEKRRLENEVLAEAKRARQAELDNVQQEENERRRAEDEARRQVKDTADAEYRRLRAERWQRAAELEASVFDGDSDAPPRGSWLTPSPAARRRCSDRGRTSGTGCSTSPRMRRVSRQR